MKKRTLLMMAGLLILVASCSKTDLQAPQGPEVPNATSVTVSLTTAPPEMSARQANRTPATTKTAGGGALVVNCGSVDTKSTPSLTTPEEQAVQNLWVIQFDKATGNRVGAPYYVQQDHITQSGTTVSLPAKLTTASTAQIIYFVANTNSPSVFHATNCGTIAQLEKVSRTLTTEYKPVSGGGLPMLGVKEFFSIESGIPLTGITLRRLVAKVTLKYKVASNYVGFTLRRVQLRNAAGTITYATEQTAAVDFPAKNVTAGSESHFDYPTEDLATAGVDGDYNTLTWYMPENLRQATTTTSDEWGRCLENTDGMATYLEMEGSLAGATRAEKITYRIPLGDFATNLNDYNVKRNTIYALEVTLIGKNAADKRITVGSFDASNAAMIVPNSGNTGAATFDIRKCINNGFTTQADLNGMLNASSALTADVLWQDGNIVNTADVTLDKVNGLLTVRSSKINQGNAIVALYPNANKKQGEILWSWHVWVTDYKPEGQASVAANTAYTVTGGQVHTYGTEYLKVNAGKVIMDRHLGATAAVYAPPADVAAGAKTFGMYYQWGRKDPLPGWDGKSAGATADAEAKTIKIYAANGTTLLTEGAKDDAAALGYKKVSVIDAGGAGPNLPYATKNPLTFIYATVTPYDWYTTAADNSVGNGLWGGGAQKSAYDPCPVGWRIAPNGTWSDFGAAPYAAPFYYYINGTKQTANDVPRHVASSRNGRLVEAGSIKAWYPTAGHRYVTTGELSNVGHHGNVWSSATNNINGQGLYFHSSNVSPNYVPSRTRAYQLRCVQE